jgi:putative flippase GtrA
LPLIETKGMQKQGKISNKIQAASVHRRHAWSSTFRQFLRYCLVGGANTAVDLLVLNILLWRFPTNNVQVLVVYNSVAYSGGAFTSFFLNKYWTFRHKQRTTWREVVRFILSLACEVLYSNGLVWLAGKALQPLIANPLIWGNASKLVAVAVGTVISYTFMRCWTFRSRSQDRPKKSASVLQTATRLPDTPISKDTEDAPDAESESMS